MKSHPFKNIWETQIKHFGRRKWNYTKLIEQTKDIHMKGGKGRVECDKNKLQKIIKVLKTKHEKKHTSIGVSFSVAAIKHYV